MKIKRLLLNLRLTRNTSFLTWPHFSALVVFSLIVLLTLQIRAQEPVLKHSYSFDDGNAKDLVGEAHGILKGSGKIQDGLFVSYGSNQFIELPADQIQINTYESLSLEAFLVAGGGNNPFTMFSYFGNITGDFGHDYIFQSVINRNLGRTSISCMNQTAPWEAETFIECKPLQDGNFHHVVTTYDNHEIRFYIDGELVGTRTNYDHNDNIISNLSNELAYLGKPGFKNDKTWLGAIDQFNIYEGVLNAESIANSAEEYLKRTDKTAKEFIKTLSHIPGIAPGFKPESELSDSFIQKYKNSKFVIYPTIIRTADKLIWSEVSAEELSSSLKNDLDIKITMENSKLDPGKISDGGQFAIYTNDLEVLSNAIKQKELANDYHMVMEILFSPQPSQNLAVFAIHLYVLNNMGENAFSILLNSHHNLFTLPGFWVEKQTEETMDFLERKCTWIALNALQIQIEHAKLEVE